MANSTVLLQLPQEGNRRAVTLTVRLVVDGEPHVEFDETVGADAGSVQLRVPYAELPLLTDVLARRAGVAVNGPDLEPWHRLLTALAGLVKRGDLGKVVELHGRNLHRLRDWCQVAGVSAVQLKTDDDRTYVLHRLQVLHRAPTASGHVRTLLFVLSPGIPPDHSDEFFVHFIEQHDGRGEAGERWSYDLCVSRGKINKLVAAVEHQLSEPAVDSPADLGERLLASTAALFASPLWGSELPPGKARDQLSTLFNESGARTTRSGKDRCWTLLTTSNSSGASSASLELQFPAEATSHVHVRERHRAGEVSSWYLVEIPSSAVGTLLQFLQTRLPDVVVPAGDAPIRLATYLIALAELGELGSLERHRKCQARFAALCAEAGVPHEKRRSERVEQLQHIHKDNCVFTVRLKFDPKDLNRGGGISFGEYSNYNSGADGYDSVQTPYAGLRTLVEFFETRLGMKPPAGVGNDADELEDRLTECFTTLVARGQASRDRVFDWFTEAGVDAKHDSGLWRSYD